MISAAAQVRRCVIRMDGEWVGVGGRKKSFNRLLETKFRQNLDYEKVKS